MGARLSLRSSVGFTAVVLGCLLAAGALSPAAGQAAAPPACAQTTDPATPPAPTPGSPCWVDVTPYPFGADGDPVDTSRRNCPTRPDLPAGGGYNTSCYLEVLSFAFRAWNRGLAATDSLGKASAFGVWRFGGVRWTPDPSFPGPSSCSGNTVLWAGKLDYWLVGSLSANTRGASWPALCRYDGSTGDWQPIDVPDATRAHGASDGKGTITSGACFAWDDCWFFGTNGTVVRWNGQALTDATPDPHYPWLHTDFTAALAGADRVGPLGVAVGTTGGPDRPDKVLPKPDGSGVPQLYASTGGPFTESPFRPPTVPAPNDRARTDLVAVAADRADHGWVAGNPVPYRPGRFFPFTPGPDERRTTSSQPAPIVPFPLRGASECTAPSPGFEYDVSEFPNGHPAYLWSALSVFPDTGDAVAAGSLRPPAAGAGADDDGHDEPVLARVACDGTVTTTRFREPARGTGPALAAADRFGWAQAIAANARNDAWASTSQGTLPAGPAQVYTQRPHVYRLADGERPDAAAGDDEESRPVTTVEDPPIFIEEPEPPEPPPPPDTVQTTQTTLPAKRTQRKAAIYGVKVSKPRRISRDEYVMVVRFRVRRPVTIGVQALRGRKVVSRSGLKRFRGSRGTLRLTITRRHWPTRLRFYSRGDG